MPDIEQLTADEVQRRRMRITRLEGEYSKLDARIETLVEVREEMRAELRELHELEDRQPDELVVPDDMLAAAPATRLRTPESEVIEVARRLGTFTLIELAAPLGVKVNRLKSIVAGLCESGKLSSTGRKFYGRPMYQYVPPEEPGAAFERQVRLPAEQPGRNGNGAQPVAYTGKPVGASGKPGRDREVARQGRRVKTKHGKA